VCGLFRGSQFPSPRAVVTFFVRRLDFEVCRLLHTTPSYSLPFYAHHSPMSVSDFPGSHRTLQLDFFTFFRRRSPSWVHGFPFLRRVFVFRERPPTSCAFARHSPLLPFYWRAAFATPPLDSRFCAPFSPRSRLLCYSCAPPSGAFLPTPLQTRHRPDPFFVSLHIGIFPGPPRSNTTTGLWIPPASSNDFTIFPPLPQFAEGVSRFLLPDSRPGVTLPNSSRVAAFRLPFFHTAFGVAR